MAFWTSPDLQPLKQNRFRVVFTPTLENPWKTDLQTIISRQKSEQQAEKEKKGSVRKPQGDFWWWVKTCTLPSYEIAMSDYQLVNHKFKYPGMLVWNDVVITMVDTNIVTETMMAMLGEAGYGGEPTCGNNGISKDGFTNQGEFRIQMIDSEGAVTKQWKLEGWFFRNVRFGDTSYETDDFVTLEMSLGYDYAILENSKGNSIVKEFQEAKKKEDDNFKAGLRDRQPRT